MLESLSMYSDEMMELLLSEEAVPDDLVYRFAKARHNNSESPQSSVAVLTRTKAYNSSWTLCFDISLAH
jgi:TRAP-type uncharacterized transport system substrate-binding protein